MDKEKLIAACTEVLAQNEEATAIINIDHTEGLRYDIGRGHGVGEIVVDIRDN